MNVLPRPYESGKMDRGSFSKRIQTRGSIVYRVFFIFLMLTACIVPVDALAALHVEAPASALQGAAVLVRVTSDTPLKGVVLHWRKKIVPVALAGQGDRYAGQALLPMPLEGLAPLVLKAATDRETQTVSIRPIPVDWPRQEVQVENKYVEPPAATMQRIKREQERTRTVLHKVTPRRLWDVPCVPPVPGRVTSPFGGQRLFNGQPRSRHRGVDLRGAAGTPVLATAAGKVVIASEQYFSGNVVYLDHGQGMISLYAHLSAIDVAEGDTVAAGQPVGKVGATGRVTGPHLHWGVMILGYPVNPLSLLDEASRPGAVRERHE